MRWLALIVMLALPLWGESLPEGMKPYYLVLLRTGPHRDQDQATLEKLQAGHLANIQRLQKEGKLDLAGPCLDEGDLRGIFILNASSLAEANELLQTDPAIAAGRLRAEVHPWLGQTGASLR